MKIDHAKNNWSFIPECISFKELLMSNDRNYLFICKSYIGIAKADCNLNQDSKWH